MSKRSFASITFLVIISLVLSTFSAAAARLQSPNGKEETSMADTGCFVRASGLQVPFIQEIQ